MALVDNKYYNICNRVLTEGEWVLNKRTQKKCLTFIGLSEKYDLSKEFPLLTTKKILTKPLVGELIGFLRGVTSAKDFRDLGCNFWDDNANKTKSWLDNPNRIGVDDLGPIYGKQARDWGGIDQLKIALEKLKDRNDDRGLIVSHWNVGDLNKMALRPCHVLYQFSLRNEDTLDLTFYQRSCDLPLGVPFNIASYALLANIAARITGLKVGSLFHVMNNVHIYEDQLETLKMQLCERDPTLHKSPSLSIDPKLKTLEDFTSSATHSDFNFKYSSYGFIKFPFTE